MVVVAARSLRRGETLQANDGSLHVSPQMLETINTLRTFLYDNVYRYCRVHNEFEKAQRIITELYGEITVRAPSRMEMTMPMPPKAPRVRICISS